MYDQELTLMSKEELEGKKRLEVMQKYDNLAAVTDLCILTGGYVSFTHVEEDNSLKGRTGFYWTKTNDYASEIYTVGAGGSICAKEANSSYISIRPVLKSSAIFSRVYPNRMSGNYNTEEVEYGEYPQYAADAKMQDILEGAYNAGMNKTGRSYTFNGGIYDEYTMERLKFKPETYEEYEYQGKKYIRIKCDIFSDYNQLSNGIRYNKENYVWVEVSPVKWLIDNKTGQLISKKCLLSGFNFHNDGKFYDGNFDKTELKEYLDRYMIHDLTQSEAFKLVQNMTQEEKIEFEEGLRKEEERRNPYGLKFKQVSEEEIIKGAVESGVAVFLHGPSSEGKSARVKQIDPTCEIIYLRNATPESLNGKSVYDQSTGEMIDIKPSWLKKLEEKCSKEPERLHILFLDEITNALPSIQGIAFNIVLDKEVNGIWQLPENARIVAAGNDMKDSLAANQLAEPLFNRFAHVYIKTTTESWLKWASEHNIHPAIYSYIAYKKGQPLRSKYDGEKPNADPRKWEMASKMLYATENPEMLRALVGEDITREFVQFCNQHVITLDDVLNENYTEENIQILNTAERYATTMGLSQVDDDNLEKVRNFVTKLGSEFVAIFYVLWIHGDESRLEKLAEAKLAEMAEGGIKR